MKVAVVHDWLVVRGGAERVLEAILSIVPGADIYTTVYDKDVFKNSEISSHKITASFVNRLPFGIKKYRNYLPLMPIAVEQFDLSKYDLIISSSYAVAKGVISGPDQIHISYVHSPMRYAWDLQSQYLRDSGFDRGIKSWLARWLLHKIRIWDLRTANGVDLFIANSKFIARRIWKIYRRKSKVIYPPVDISSFDLVENKSDYYVTASRMVPYKKIATIVEAFAEMKEKKLVVIGDGPDMKKVRSKAMPNIEILGYQPDDVLRDYLKRAKAFVFAAEEDFGILPVEAQACGTPVIAYGKGGVLETVNSLDSAMPTGIFFEEQSVSSIIKAVEEFESVSEKIKAASCRENAARFSQERFAAEFKKLLDVELKKQKGMGESDIIIN